MCVPPYYLAKADAEIAGYEKEGYRRRDQKRRVVMGEKKWRSNNPDGTRFVKASDPQDVQDAAYGVWEAKGQLHKPLALLLDLCKRAPPPAGLAAPSRAPPPSSRAPKRPPGPRAQGRAGLGALVQVTCPGTDRRWIFFFAWGAALTAGPTRSPHSGRSAPALAQRTTHWWQPPALCAPLQEGQVRVQESPHNTDGLPLFSRGAIRASCW
jgi:hypothetical protein